MTVAAVVHGAVGLGKHDLPEVVGQHHPCPADTDALVRIGDWLLLVQHDPCAVTESTTVFGSTDPDSVMSPTEMFRPVLAVAESQPAGRDRAQLGNVQAG